MGHLILPLPTRLVAAVACVGLTLLILVLAYGDEEEAAPPAPIAPESDLVTWNASLADPASAETAISRDEAIAIAQSTVYPSDAEVVGARLVRIEPGLDVSATALAWAVDFDTETGDVNNPEGSRWFVARHMVYYAMVIHAGSGDPLFSVDGGRGSPVARDVELVLVISNVDGPPLEVIPWQGAEKVDVPCPGGWVFARRGAPDPPWHFVVRSAFTGEVMREETYSPRPDTPTVIVRRTVALFGFGPASAGPAPLRGCLQEGESE